jgi:hypothetical protein
MPDWQTIATLIVLVAVGVFLVRRLLTFVRGSKPGGCGSCASGTGQAKTKPLVPLDVPDRHVPDQRR